MAFYTQVSGPITLSSIAAATANLFPCGTFYIHRLECTLRLAINFLRMFSDEGVYCPEVDFLDEIQTKVWGVFLLAIHSALYRQLCLRFMFLQTHATSDVFLQTHVTFNRFLWVKSENSQDYTQKPQWYCIFMNSASGCWEWGARPSPPIPFHSFYPLHSSFSAHSTPSPHQKCRELATCTLLYRPSPLLSVCISQFVLCTVYSMFLTEKLRLLSANYTFSCMLYASLFHPTLQGIHWKHLFLSVCW